MLLKVLWFEQQYELSRQKRDSDNHEDINKSDQRVDVIQQIVTSHHSNDESSASSGNQVLENAEKWLHRASSAGVTGFSASNISQNSQHKVDLKKVQTFQPPNDPYWHSQWYLVSF